MSLNPITVPPRFIEALNLNDEVKKNVKINIGNISESEALIMFEEDLNKKLFQYLKRMCRNSYEYKEYIKYFKEELGYSSCKVFGIDVSKIKIGLEVHHTPFSMESIVKAVSYKQFIDKGNNVDTKDIAEEVMKLHYEGKIGLLPVTSTIHEAIHNNTIYVKVSDIYGDYERFFEEYEEYLDDDAIDHYNNVISLDDRVVETYNKEKLKRIISEYDVTYEEDLMKN